MTARRSRPSPRRIAQKIALWTTILLTTLWVGSGWFRWHSAPPDNAWIGIAGGRFIGGCIHPSLPALNTVNPTSSSLYKTDQPFLAFLDASVDLILDTPRPPRHLAAPLAWSSGRHGFVVGIPIWSIIAPALLATVLLYRKDIVAARRRSRGRCPRCNYDRTGLAPETKCPECGASLPGTP